MGKKLILPTEVKVCATCSYWDGSRKVDEELQVVVVDEACRGECLVQEKDFDGLVDTRLVHECAWEPISDAESAEDSAPLGPAAFDDAQYDDAIHPRHETCAGKA